MKDEFELLDLFGRALASKKGILVRSDDANLLRQKLYTLRRNNPEYATLSFTLSRTAPETELLIVKA